MDQGAGAIPGGNVLNIKSGVFVSGVREALGSTTGQTANQGSIAFGAIPSGFPLSLFAYGGKIVTVDGAFSVSANGGTTTSALVVAVDEVCNEALAVAASGTLAKSVVGMSIHQLNDNLMVGYIAKLTSHAPYDRVTQTAAVAAVTDHCLFNTTTAGPVPPGHDQRRRAAHAPRDAHELQLLRDKPGQLPDHHRRRDHAARGARVNGSRKKLNKRISAQRSHV